MLAQSQLNLWSIENKYTFVINVFYLVSFILYSERRLICS